MEEKIAAFADGGKRRILRTSFCQRLIHQFDPVQNLRTSGAGQMILAADVGRDDQLRAPLSSALRRLSRSCRARVGCVSE
jgi:hypothetical protein